MVKTGHKVIGLLLLLIALATVLSPLPTLAQTVKAEAVKIDLTMRIVGDYYSEVKAGQDNFLLLEIRNNGREAITNIKLTSDQDTGWSIEFKPAEVAYLAPGSAEIVDVNIRPPERINRGDYHFTVIAEATQTRRAESIWVRVSSGSFWLWVGAIVGAAVIAAFIIIFIRFGRK